MKKTLLVFFALLSSVNGEEFLSVEYENASIGTVMSSIMDGSEFNIVFSVDSFRTHDGKEMKVTVRLEKVSAEVALQALAKAVNAKVEILEGNVYVFYPKKGFLDQFVENLNSYDGERDSDTEEKKRISYEDWASPSKNVEIDYQELLKRRSVQPAAGTDAAR